MNLNEPLLAELKHESANTRKMLERIPAEKFSWRPHTKSMTLGRLAGHLAELSGWLNATIEADELDFSKFEYTPKQYTTLAELLQDFDDALAKGTVALQSANNENLMGSWKLRNGEHVFFEMPRIAVVRAMVLSHIIHHRGQLSVYLRLLDVRVPGMYGPSADEGNTN